MSKKIREKITWPDHASPAGGHASGAFVASLFAGAVFVFTAAALAGPPNVVRSLILIGYLFAGIVLCRFLFHLTDRAGWARRPWLQALGVAAVGAVVVGLGLFAMQSILNAQIRWETLPWILALALGLSCSGCALTVSRRPRLAPPSALNVNVKATSNETVRFMERLPASMRTAELLALQAEDHYLRVYTTLGETLILMRLSDAIAELSSLDGARTHRSWWTARSAVQDVIREGRQATLVLKTGCRAPVSRTQLKALRRLNWI